MLALKFTAVEYFSLLVLGLIAAVVLAHGSVAEEQNASSSILAAVRI